MDSVSKKQYANLVCPNAEFPNEEDEFHWTQFRELPTLPDANYKSSLSSSSHLRPLDPCMEDNHATDCAVCIYKMNLYLEIHRSPELYFCKVPSCFISGRNFSIHRACIEPISKHPYHPKHSLRLILSYPSKICLYCSKKERIFRYSCSICDFSMCLECSSKEPLLEIDYPKRHEHTLFYNYRKSSLVCDICALSDHRSLMYSCGPCDFIVHKQCVYFPSILRISRHEHRLSFNSSLTPEKCSCGVCRQRIYTNYGRYSCVKGCSYGVHSKCATRDDIWDGKELEGVPEDAYEDIRSFVDISEGIIQHFSHENHHMRLDEKTDRAFDENKHCQACTLPIWDDVIYTCMKCDFILHKECAHLPRKKKQVTHPHRLSLQVNDPAHFKCSACDRYTNGFVYSCNEWLCSYKLDVQCASIAEPFDHRCHQHHLFITFEPDSEQICSVCHESRGHRLNCEECGFVVCFGCATLPNKTRHKHDEHVLIFFYEEEVTGKYLCEVCEKEADPKNGIYMCNDCNTVMHIQCLFGKDMYMMPSGTFHFREVNFPILLNNRFTRNICKHCHNRCEEKVVYKLPDKEITCSFMCLYLLHNQY